MIRLKDILRYGPLYLLAAGVSLSVSVGGIATGLTLVAALFLVVSREVDLCLPDRRVIWALFGLIGIYFLATIFSSPYPHHWHKFFEELWIKLLLVAVPVVVGRRTDHVVRLVKVALGFGVAAGLYAIWQHFSEYDPIRHCSLIRPQWGQPAVTGFFGHHLSYGGQVLIFFTLAFSWAFIEPLRRSRAWLPGALLVLGAALVWSFARSALLGVVAGALCLTLLAEGRRRWLSVATLAVGFSGILLLPAVRAHLLMLFEIKRHVTRLNLWESSWLGIQARPLLGFGPGNFESLLAGFKVDGYYETLAHSHNDLLMHGVNAGVPGMVAALALLVVTCRVIWSGWRRRVAEGWILAGALSVQAGITVAGFFQVYQTDDEVEILLYFLLGCAVALAGQGRSGDLEIKSDV